MTSFTIAYGFESKELITIVIIFILILIPSIIIKTILFKNILKKNWGESFKVSGIANLASLTAGIFFTVLVLKIASSVGADVNLFWPILTLVLVICIEKIIAQKYWKDISGKKLLRAIISVNIIVLGTFAVILLFLPPLSGVREKTRRISCLSNLKGIGMSLIQYSLDYNNFFPDKGLEQLRANDYLTDYGVYKCPSTDTRKGKNNEKLTDEIVDYVYPKGLKYNSNDSKTPLLWDKPENHQNYGNVLFIDGHVEAFKGVDWMEQAGIKKAQK